MEHIYVTGTTTGTQKSVGEPGFKESLIPVWGSGRAAVNHFQNGNYVRSAVYTALAITDVFLVKSLIVGGGKILVKGAATLIGKESEQALAKLSVEGLKRAPSLSAATANDLVVKASASEFSALGTRIGPGAQIAQIDGWWIKRIDSSANWFRRGWGGLSIEAQHEGLVKLGSEMAPEFFIRDGMLFTKTVGLTRPALNGGTFWGSFFKGSYRMGTLLNDIRPRNMGINGLIFDPAVDPLIKSIFWSGIYGGSAESRIILRTP